MKIKGIDLSVNAAAGALGWWGEGYWYHNIYKKISPSFKETVENLNFVAKTATMNMQIGHLRLKADYTPRDMFPSCIKVYPFRGEMLNAVKLSGPKYRILSDTGNWQKVRRQALGISFMPVGKTIEDMISETISFRDQFMIDSQNFQSPVYAQFNGSCPNTGPEHLQLVIANLAKLLEILQPLRTERGLVLDLKINLLMPNSVVKELWRRDLFDLVTLSNTLPYGTEGFGIKWRYRRLLFWSKKSPLARFGGGGLSGKRLFKPVCEKIRSLRQDVPGLLIKGSGGILSVERVRIMKACGINVGIEFATVISLRPWRIKKMIAEAKKIFDQA